jgi:hypothetical protein
LSCNVNSSLLWHCTISDVVALCHACEKVKAQVRIEKAVVFYYGRNFCTKKEIKFLLFPQTHVSSGLHFSPSHIAVKREFPSIFSFHK